MDIEFDWSLIEAICDASGIDMSEFRSEDEDKACSLLHQWYAEHRAHGGAADPIMEDIVIEAKLDEIFGGVRHEPGNN